MMKKFIAPLLALLVSGCQIHPDTLRANLDQHRLGTDVGMEDAISGQRHKR